MTLFTVCTNPESASYSAFTMLAGVLWERTGLSREEALGYLIKALLEAPPVGGYVFTRVINIEGKDSQ